MSGIPALLPTYRLTSDQISYGTSMEQGTVIINARELFGDFSDYRGFKAWRDGHEAYWQWPKKIGKGFLYALKLRPGLMLAIGSYRLSEGVAISFDLDYSPLVLAFSLSGGIHHTVTCREGQRDFWHFKPGHSVMTYAPECQGISRSPIGITLGGVAIHIAPLLLNDVMEGHQDLIPAGLRDIANGDGSFFHHTSAMTPSVRVVVHQIINCPYGIPLRRLYLEGKTLELLFQSMAHLVWPETVSRPLVLRSDDVDRIREARRILLNSIEDPPSLFELARQVGTNKNKLNKGFQQLFGTTVFDYLRISRLERARELLETKKKSVTEVAFEVGYAQHSNFTKAFKRHFGTPPADYLREDRFPRQGACRLPTSAISMSYPQLKNYS